jgi:thymidylate kinase
MAKDAQDLTRLVDSVVPEPVLVFGSLPPRGRDLDLLAAPAGERALGEGLARHGFAQAGHTWARFDSCSPDIVEVKPVVGWGLPADEVSALFAEARPVGDCVNLVRPAPHHALLILARRLVRGRGRLSERHRNRVTGALEEDPDALERARERAAAWGAQRSLDWLESAFSSGGTVPLSARLRALRVEWRARGAGTMRSWLCAWRGVLVRPRLGCVFALSGLDGAGKSSQADRLREALIKLGFEAVVAWPAIDAPSRWLRATARLGKAIVIPRSGRSADLGSQAAGTSQDEAKDAVSDRRGGIALLWSTIVSLRGALRLARMTWPHVLRGKIVVCDRYLLDSRVYLPYQYGEGRSYALQVGIMRLLSPRARLGFLLEVPPENASRRQPERTVEQNARRARLYAQHAHREGARVIDGTRLPDEVCAEIAKEAWLSLAE